MGPQQPGYTADEALTRETFLALMWAFSYPGRVHALPEANPYQAIADTLLDLETSYFSPDDSLAFYLARTGARALTPDRAAYHFYPTLDETLLEVVETAAVGTMLFPEEAATLIVGARFGEGLTFRLQGPGLPPATPRLIRIAGVPRAFWQVRANANQYPLGWDIYLVNGMQVIGIPRTTDMSLVE